jgi:hypothetical protein
MVKDRPLKPRRLGLHVKKAFEKAVAADRNAIKGF